MAEVYTGEVVQEAAGPKPYTGEVVPLAGAAAPKGDDTGAAVTGRTQVPRPRQTEDTTTGFIAGNINKGIAGLAGLPVDTARNVANLGIAGYGAGQGAVSSALNRGSMGGAHLPAPIEPGPGSSQWFEGLMRRGNMIGPGAEPQSGPGRYAAAALQAVPGAMAGRPSIPQVPRALGAAVSSGLGGEAAADIGGEEWRGVGAMAPGAGKVQHKGAGERATEARQGERFAQAKSLGIPIPPREIKVDKPQQKIQDAGNRDLRQPPGTEFSPENLKKFMKAHYAEGYEPLAKAMQPLVPNKTFQDTIKAMRAEEMPPPGQLPKTFKGNKEVLDLLADYQQGTTMQPKVALRAITKLREDASSNFSSDKPEKRALAKSQKGIANALEQLIDDNLAASGNQDLLGKYRNSRTMIAKAHDYMDSLVPGNKISGPQMAQAQVSGKPLSGGAKDIAEVAGAFPGALAAPKEQELFTRRVSPMAMTHPTAAAAHWTTRLADPIRNSPPYQALFVDPRTKLSPEQQQALRYLLGAQGANRGSQISTPPE